MYGDGEMNEVMYFAYQIKSPTITVLNIHVLPPVIVCNFKMFMIYFIASEPTVFWKMLMITWMLIVWMPSSWPWTIH